MASIERRGEQYRVRWWTADGHQRTRTCPTLGVARDLQHAVESAAALGIVWEPQGARGAPGLEEVARAYLGSRALRLRPRTLLRYGENLDLFLRFLRERPLAPASKRSASGPRSDADRGGGSGSGSGPPTAAASRLSRPLLEAYFAWLCRTGGGLHGRRRGPDTARKILEVAELMWEWAEQSDRWPGLIPPPRRIDLPPRGERRPVVAPTWAEMDACLAQLRPGSFHHRIGVVLRYTGLRLGEAALLEVRDFNRAAGTLMLRAETSKTSAGRILPISEHLCRAIDGWPARPAKAQGYLVPGDPDLVSTDRLRAARSAVFARAWAAATEAGSVRPEAWAGRPALAFRAGWKSGMLALGAAPDAVDYLQGHELSRRSPRLRYLDPWLAFPLRETVGRVPAITPPTSTA